MKRTLIVNGAHWQADTLNAVEQSLVDALPNYRVYVAPMEAWSVIATQRLCVVEINALTTLERSLLPTLFAMLSEAVSR